MQPLRKFLQVTATLVALLIGAGSSQAAIVVSGDSNIANALVGSFTPVNPGNQQFFRNVLGGGDRVVVQDEDIFANGAGGFINTFYNTQPGVLSTLLVGPITPAALVGVDLFFSVLPADPYTAAEIAALSAFLSGGGTIFFLGDNGGFASNPNARINAALTALDSGLQIVNDSIDSGFNTATGSQIASDPLTAGVTSFTYAFASRATGGTPLFFGTQQRPFVAREGDITAIPEPASLVLGGIGALGVVIGAARRRTRAA